MKRLILLTALLLGFPLFAEAQTATVTGSVKYPTGGNPTRASVCFTLENYKPNHPRVSGSYVLINQTNFCVNADASGGISTTLVRNDQITPSGTYWTVDFKYNNLLQSRTAFNVNSASFDLDTAAPITTVPVATPPTGDTTYQRTDGGNQATGSYVPSTDGTLALGSAAATWDAFLDDVVAGKINNILYVDGVKYTTIQAAHDAASAGDIIVIPRGTQAPTSTLSITKSITIIGQGKAFTTVAPTAAVTTQAININTSGRVILAGFTLDLTAITSIKAVNITQAGSFSRFEHIRVNKGTYGFDIASTGLSYFGNLEVEAASTAYIRLQDDSGGENTFENVWMVNNAGQAVTDGFLLSRTTTTDVGGLYIRGVRYVQNSATGGATTNGFRFVSTAGTPTPIFLVMSDSVADGVTGDDTVKLDNVKKVQFQNCTFTNGSAAGNNKAALQILNSSEVFATGNNNWASSGHSVRIKGTVDIIQIQGAILAAGSGKNAVFLDTTPTMSNVFIGRNHVDSSVTFTNDVDALRAASLGQYMDATGGFELRGAAAFMRVPNATFYQSLTAAGANAAIVGINSSDQVQHQAVSGAAQIFYSDQATTEKMRIDAQGVGTKRIRSTGTALVAGDFALHANWGTGAAIGTISGTDQAWVGTVTAAGTPGANPTLILTFKDGTWTSAPLCISKMTGGSGTITDLSDSTSATAHTITFNGTPVAASNYIITSICIGR